MNYKKFDSDDILRNVIKTYPENHITFYNGDVYINHFNQILASDSKNSNLFAGNITNFYTSNDQYYLNYTINKKYYSFFVPKNLSYEQLKQTATDYQTTSKISSSINCYISNSVNTEENNLVNLYFSSLKNTLEWNSSVSPWYNVSNFKNKELALINIPSIFYGSTIKRGSVEINFYFTGSHIAKLEDIDYGKLVETTGSSIGSNAGVILYDEGIILLSGSWSLGTDDGGYTPISKWNTFPKSTSNLFSEQTHFDLKFKGTNYIPTITMFARADKNEFNTTTNKTWIDRTQENFTYINSSSNTYKEDEYIEIKNTVKTNYTTVSGSFKKQTFINKIGIYDKDHKLIAVARLATPVKKNNERDYTFKLKLDL